MLVPGKTAPIEWRHTRLSRSFSMMGLDVRWFSMRDKFKMHGLKFHFSVKMNRFVVVK
jgi:hypothetical protein